MPNKKSKRRQSAVDESAKEKAFRKRKAEQDKRRFEQVAEADAQKENCDPNVSEAESDDDNFERSFLPHSSTGGHQEDSSDDDDQEPTRSHLTESFYNKKQLQRTQHHPTMVPRTKDNPRKKAPPRSQSGSKGSRSGTNRTQDGKPPAKKKARRDESDGEESDDSRTTVGEETARKLKEAEKLARKLKEQEEEMERLRLRVKNADAKPRSRKSQSGTKGTVSAEERLVYQTAKGEFFKTCKFIKDKAQLIAATRIVMDMLDLQSLEGLRGSALVKAEEEWIAENQDTVREAINDWRNYIVGELYKFMFSNKDAIFVTNRIEEVPTPDEILKLSQRIGLQDGDPNVEAMRTKFDVHWDEMIPKVAGHACWGPGKRHQGCMSTMRPYDDEDEELYVTPSDEAFLVVCWENCWNRWHYIKKFKDEDKEMTAEDKKDAKYQTPYTKPKGGVQQYGGWNKAGRKRYREILDLIKESKDKDHVEEVEKAALARIRIKHDCATKEATRKTKKTTTIMEELDSDHEPDWL